MMYEEHSPVDSNRYSKLARKHFREKERWHKSRARMSYARKLEVLDRMLQMYREMPKPTPPE
jgi:hypothetical protein